MSRLLLEITMLYKNYLPVVASSLTHPPVKPWDMARDL